MFRILPFQENQFKLENIQILSKVVINKNMDLHGNKKKDT